MSPAEFERISAKIKLNRQRSVARVKAVMQTTWDAQRAKKNKDLTMTEQRRKDDLERATAPHDPMVHRGIGDAVKDSFDQERLSQWEKESKKKARSDRMKATWAAQREAAIDLKLP